MAKGVKSLKFNSLDAIDDEHAQDREDLKRILSESVTQIRSMRRGAKPKTIFLSGTDQNYLVKFSLDLYAAFLKNRTLKVFTGEPVNGEYSIDIDHYLRLYAKQRGEEANSQEFS